MKIISSKNKKIARVECSCCGDDHFVDIRFNTDLDERDPDEYLFEFEFDTGWDSYPPLKDRIRDSINLLKNEDNFRHEQYVDAILVDPGQLLELYETMREYIDPILTEEQKKTIDNPEKPEFIKHYIKFKKQTKNDWAEVFPFRGKDGLTYYLDHFEYEEEVGDKLRVTDGGIGWFFDTDEYTKKSIRRYARWWIFKKSRSGMRHYYASLSKEDAIKFLSSINYIFSNMEEDEKGIPCIMI